MKCYQPVDSHLILKMVKLLHYGMDYIRQNINDARMDMYSEILELTHRQNSFL